MKYKSALVTDLSGSLEGLTASRNKGGQYFRARVIPTNPQTPLQSQAREAFGQQAMSWAALTGSERTFWIDFAPLVEATGPLGQDVALSGQNAYMQATVPIQFLNEFEGSPQLTMILLPPTNPTGSPTGTSPTIAAASQATGNVDVAFDITDAWANSDEGALMVYVTQPAPAGRRPQDQQFRFAGIVLGDATTPPTSPAALVSPWVWAPNDVGKQFTIATSTMVPIVNMPGQRDRGASFDLGA